MNDKNAKRELTFSENDAILHACDVLRNLMGSRVLSSYRFDDCTDVVAEKMAKHLEAVLVEMLASGPDAAELA